MTAYYNEIDPYCVGWLRNLIREELIADGIVDDRSISDVVPNDLKGFTQCHFFAGLGGWSGALRRSGVWPDHRTVWTGSCPCQPFSLAGKQGGFDDKRHLWPAWQWLIEQCKPATILGEQVASASAWLRLVRGDLEAMGYAVGAIPIEAASAGADHLRDRYWFVAHGNGQREASLGRIPQGTQSEFDGTDSGAVGHDPRNGWRERWTEYAVHERNRTTAAEPSSTGFFMANNDGRGLGGSEVCEKQSRRAEVNGNMEHAARFAQREPNDQSDAFADGRQTRPVSSGAGDHFEWVIGADGKARRVKPGVRLLAHGIPNRVAKLRALGNAIDLRPAAEFIKAIHESI